MSKSQNTEANSFKNEFEKLLRWAGKQKKDLAADTDIRQETISRDLSHGPTNRDRVIAYIDWFRQQRVLTQLDQANTLLGLARMPYLDSASPREAELAGRLKLAPAPKRMRRLVLGGILTAAAGAAIIYLLVRSAVPVWEESFDPLDASNWTEAGAKWEDLTGPTAVLHENNPLDFYGKVETEAIQIDLDTSPILEVDVSKIDSKTTSYSVELIQQSPFENRKLLEQIVSPGKRTVNIAQQTGWSGPHTFTINIWVSGEGKSVTFRRIAIMAEGR